MDELHTEVHRVESRNLTTQCLHDEGCHRIAHMSTIRQDEAQQMI